VATVVSRILSLRYFHSHARDTVRTDSPHGTGVPNDLRISVRRGTLVGSLMQGQLGTRVLIAIFGISKLSRKLLNELTPFS